MAPAINHDDLMMFRQRRNLLTPVIGIRQPAVEQNHRRTLSGGGVIELDPVYAGIRGFSAATGAGVGGKFFQRSPQASGIAGSPTRPPRRGAQRPHHAEESGEE